MNDFKIVQDSLYDIAKAAHTIKDTFSLYKKIHTIIAKLMYAGNMYIALYDKNSQELKFEYYVDVVDSDFKVGSKLKISNKSVTAYCIKKKKPVLLTRDDLINLTNKKVINPVGSISETWLGVPLITQNNIIGVITIQSYDPKYVITSKDKDRPLLKGQDPSKVLADLQESRQAFYEEVSDHIINTENKSGSDVANEIVKLVKNYG